MSGAMTGGLRELRPRTIEWNKPLPIIRDEGDLEEIDSGEMDLEEAGLSSDIAAYDSRKEAHAISSGNNRGNAKVPEALSKEIFIPAAQPLSIDLKEAGIEFTYLPVDRSTTKRHIRWRGLLDSQSNPVPEEDPLSSIVSYHLYLGDVLLLREINKFKPLITQEDYRKSFDTWEKATSTGPLIEQSRAIELANKRGVDCPVNVLNEVYKAWVFRRQQLKRPLMRLFWPIGVAGEEPPTSSTLRFRAAAKMRLRRPRRNNEDLLHRAGIAKRDARNVIRLAHRLVVREKLKRSKICLSNAIAKQTRFDLGLSKKEPVLDSLVSTAQAVLTEELVPHDDSQFIEPHRHLRTKLLMVAETPRTGGGMLGGLAAISAHAADGEGGQQGLHGNMGQSYLNSQRIKTRVRLGRSNRIYVDRVREADRETNKFLPTFQQWDEFGNPDSIGAIYPEADVKEFSEKYLDELYELTKSIRQSVFQHSADALPSLAQTSDSEDTLQRDIQWFVESWNAFKGLAERIDSQVPLTCEEIHL